MSLPAGEQHATKEVQEICDQVKTTVEKMIGRNLKRKSGQQGKIRVCVGGNEYFHVLIHRTVSETGEVKTTVEKVEQKHTKDDIIIPVN